jgi:pimeloyl-ACP methyl ester carboxylesterase
MFNPKQKQLIIDGLLVNGYLSEETKSQKPTLVFIHGWRSESSLWFKSINQMKIDCPVVLIDMPGFGKSEIPDKPFSISDYINIVIKYLEKLDIKKFIIVGHSFGGRIAIKLTAINSENVAGLVLVDAAGLIKDTKLKNIKQMSAKLLKPFFSFACMQPLRKKIYQLMQSEDYLATPQIIGTYKNIIAEDLEPYLKQIKSPTLIIWGENDKEVPLTFAQTMHNQINKSKLIIMNSGHFPFLDNPTEFAQHIHNFIANL